MFTSVGEGERPVNKITHWAIENKLNETTKRTNKVYFETMNILLYKEYPIEIWNDFILKLEYNLKLKLVWSMQSI